MKSNLKNEIIDLLTPNTELIDKYASRKKISKNEIILSEGQAASVTFYIFEGITRNFIINDGKEITLQFNFAKDIVFPLNSYKKNLKSDEYIQALTDLDIVKLNLYDYEIIKTDNTELKELELKLNELYILHTAKRLRDFQTSTAKERYLELIKTEPEILQYCQLSHIASYLGINLGSLSRIRSEI